LQFIPDFFNAFADKIEQRALVSYICNKLLGEIFIVFRCGGYRMPLFISFLHLELSARFDYIISDASGDWRVMAEVNIK